MINVLGIDTAYRQGCITLKKNNQYFSKKSLGLQGQSEHLLPLLDTLLKESDCRLSDLNCLAFSAGPASFTGIRLGLSVVQGLALPHGLPVVAVDSLMALAQSYFYEKNYLKIFVCTNAHMGQIFCAAFDFSKKESDGCVVKPSQILSYTDIPTLHGSDWIGIGEGWDLDDPAIKLSRQACVHIEADFLPVDATSLTDIAENSYQRGEAKPADTIIPFYLREAHAWKKLDSILV